MVQANNKTLLVCNIMNREHFALTLRKLYLRSTLFRKLTNIILTFRCNDLDTLTFIRTKYLETNAIGPLQRDEAILLFGLTRTLRPKNVVEFGFCGGASAFCILGALENDAHFHTYDIMPEAAEKAKILYSHDKRLIFHLCSQAEFDSSPFLNSSVDFVFFDGAHDLAINVETFKKIKPVLSPGAIIAVHDTGAWNKRFFGTLHNQFAESNPGGWINDELYYHQPDEVRFVEFLRTNLYASVALHSQRCLRHGISLLQKVVG